MFFVLGKSGSGKSTLLNVLGGLDKADSGSVVIDGNDVLKFGEKELEVTATDTAASYFRSSTYCRC